MTRRYDPGSAPKPRRPALLHAETLGPTGNSRNQRRQRAKLSFREQAALALAMKFPVPELLPVTPERQAAWIARWETQYAAK